MFKSAIIQIQPYYPKLAQKMNMFLSKYINNIDKKQRVSVPPAYRNILSSNGCPGLIMYPSIKNPAIEVCSQAQLEVLYKRILALDPYSDEKDALESILLGESVILNFDSEGRVILPKNFIEFASIQDKVCFIGKGSVIEIWNPDNLDKHLDKARQIAKNNIGLLKNGN